MLPLFSGQNNVYVKQKTISHDAQNCNTESNLSDNIKHGITNTQHFKVLSFCASILATSKSYSKLMVNSLLKRFTDFPQLPWKILSTIGLPNVYEFHFLCSVYWPIHS